MGSKVMGVAMVALLVVAGAGCGKSQTGGASASLSASSTTAGEGAYCATARQENADPRLKSTDLKTNFDALISWRVKEAPIAPAGVHADVQADLTVLRAEQAAWARAGYDDNRVSEADRDTISSDESGTLETRIDQFNQDHCGIPAAPAGSSGYSKFSSIGSAIR
jgi:hypothetical protein